MPVHPPRNGVLTAGNWIVDHVKMIDLYPSEDALATITAQSTGNGGAAYNVAKDLALLQCGFPLYGSGLIGGDSDGDAILADCKAHGIDTTLLQRDGSAPTSFTDVMTVCDSGRRTFFHQRGANARFSAEHCALEKIPARHLHLGYFGLLDALDAIGTDGLSGHQHILRRARAAGMTTSADLVSAQGVDFRTLVCQALADIDYLFLNEFEAGKITGLDSGPAAAPDPAAMEQQARAVLNEGVGKAVFLHFSGGVIAVTTDGYTLRQGAVKVPADKIHGAAGAGDALAAGILLGLMQEHTLAETLETGVCAAAAALAAPTCSASLKPWRDCLKYGRTLGYRKL